MRNINDVLPVYNIQIQKNYVFKKDPNMVGSKISIIIPYGFMNGTDILIPVYMEILNNYLVKNSKYLRCNYSVGLNYSRLDLTIMNEINQLPLLMMVFNTMKTMSTDIENVYNTFVAWDLIESLKTFRHMDEYGYVKNFDKAYKDIIEIAKDETKCKEALKKCCELIGEEECFIFYQSRNQIEYFNRHDKEFKLDDIEWDLDKLAEKKYLIPFDNLYDLLICKELLHSTSVFSTDVKKYKDKHYLLINNEKAMVKSAISSMTDMFDEIFADIYATELYSFISSNFLNILNNHKRDLNYSIKAFLTGSEVFEDEREIEKVYEYSIQDIKKLFINNVAKFITGE